MSMQAHWATMDVPGTEYMDRSNNKKRARTTASTGLPESSGKRSRRSHPEDAGTSSDGALHPRPMPLFRTLEEARTASKHGQSFGLRSEGSSFTVY
jgi:hypothetical protein